MTELDMREFVAVSLDAAADELWCRLKDEGFATEQIMKAIAANMLDLVCVDLIELDTAEDEFMKLCQRRYLANRARRVAGQH